MRRVGRLLFVVMLMFGVSACQSVAAGATPTPLLTTTVALLKPIVQPDAGAQPIISILNSAQKTIRMEMDWLSDRAILDALKAARGRGVDVRVILAVQPTGSGAGNRPAQNDLQAANISVRMGNPAYRLTREKAIVVDDQIALIMTLNQTRAAFTTNREYGIMDTHPDDVAEIVNVFEADWKRGALTVSNPNLVWSPVNARQRLGALIDRANQTLDIETEELQDRAVEDRLIAAVQRGVTVRVVMSPAPSGNDTNAVGQERIARGGVLLRLVKTPYIHATMIVVDNTRAFVGSQNISTASLDFNRELGILLVDSSVLQVLSETFAHDWNIGK